MAKYRNDLTAEYVKSILGYNPKTGELRWKVNRPPRGKKGGLAGWVGANGYRYVKLGKYDLLAHRLIWFMMTGNWPKKHIDHKNGERCDNRFENIREARFKDNTRNSRRKIGVSGYKGVAPACGKKFMAKICVNKKQIYLGVFNTPKEAHKAYRTAAKKYHKEFANFG